MTVMIPSKEMKVCLSACLALLPSFFQLCFDQTQSGFRRRQVGFGDVKLASIAISRTLDTLALSTGDKALSEKETGGQRISAAVVATSQNQMR